MPTPAKTSDAEILQAARDLLERCGSEAFALADVALAVGVKTPSLYKRIAGRASLLSALEQRGFEELGEQLAAASRDDDALAAMARAYRRFALASPRLYVRMLSPDATRSDESLRWRQATVTPVLTALAALVGPQRSLVAARTVTAFLHGFVSMELAGAFRLGGDIDTDFDIAVCAVLRGITTIAD